MSTALKLPAKLDLPAASKLASDLRNCAGDVRLDASEVTHLGALCLQTLIVAARHAKDSGQGFQIDGLQERAIEQISLMGITPEQLMEGAQ